VGFMIYTVHKITIDVEGHYQDMVENSS